MNVTTKDIKVINIETNTEEDTNIFFPPNPVTNDHILLLKLKPNILAKKVNLFIEGKSSKGSGEEHVDFHPYLASYLLIKEILKK